MPCELTSKSQSPISATRIIVAVLCYAVGQFLMIGADAQKYFVLQVRKGLLDYGFFERTRNPNYLGEILIYLAFGIVAQSWAVYCFLVTVWATVFHLNMINKELSLSQKIGYEEYKARSYYLLPRFFDSDATNVVVYVGGATLLYMIYLCN